MNIYEIACSFLGYRYLNNIKLLNDMFGGLEYIFKQKKESLNKIPGIDIKFINKLTNKTLLERAEKEQIYLLKNNIKTVFYTDNFFPQRLLNCNDHPILLYYKGTENFNNKKIISIVGTRDSTKYGEDSCNKIISELKHHNLVVISGLAFGIDIAAHKSALANNLVTFGILGHGLDKTYPTTHVKYLPEIIEKGGIVTEFHTKIKPERYHFPQRNRIIAGMCDALIVIEAKKHGGAIITANIANSYNKDVFALPGNIDSLMSEGTNNLIKTNKAVLINSAKDIEYILGWTEEPKANNGIQQQILFELSEDEKIFIEIIKSSESVSIDEISIRTNMQMSKVSAILLDMEFKGIIKSLPGKRYKIL